MDSKQRSEMRNVIKTFVSQNKGFSSRQIKNEVRKSGIDISATDISKYLKKKFEKERCALYPRPEGRGFTARWVKQSCLIKNHDVSISVYIVTGETKK